MIIQRPTLVFNSLNMRRMKPRRGGTGAGTQVTLTLTWTSGAGTLTPTFTLTGAILSGDTITLRIYSDAGLTALVASDANTVDGSEEISGSLSFPGIGSLSAGTYYAVATLAASGRSGTSNTETKTLIVFTPASLFSGGEQGFWYDFSDTTKVFSDAGITPITNGGGVYQVNDKSGNGHNLTQATAGSRPTWNSAGYAVFDGTSDWLAKLGSAPDLYASGAATVFMLMKSTSPTSGSFGVVLAKNVGSQGLYAPIWAASTANHGVRIRNDAGTLIDTTVQNSVWDGTKRIIGVRDTGTQYIPYQGSTAGTAANYTRSGVVTLNNLILGNVYTASAGSSWFKMDECYQVIGINRQLTSGEISDLATWLGTK